jgi:predicted alpha/beta superfamily hydrolase
MKNLILFLGLVTSLSMLCSCNGDEDIIDPIDIIAPRTDNFSLPSKYVFDNYSYPIKVYLPASYKTNKNLPIIYILDGAMNFDKVKSKANNVAIIVGIGDFAFKEEMTRRFADFMPGTKCMGAQGKHLDFYNFITRELVPQIDINYDNDHDSRSLIGHSAAGIFTFLSVFLEDPKNVLFHNFIAIDPNLACDPDYFSGTLHDNNFSEGEKPFKFYLTVTSGTYAQGQIAEEIQAKAYTWLSFRYEKFTNEDHMSVVDPSLESGLSFIFEP